MATHNYLTSRIKKLTEREKYVSIILDEVYSAKRIEYVGGQFYGLENANITQTLLCFMVKSLAGKYEDVVAMIPLASINSTVINDWFNRVLKEISNIGFKVAAVLTDAHTANRRFFVEELCNGSLSTSIQHPFEANSRIFLLFDSVHVFKNLYNNFLNRREFDCPPFEGNTMKAKFEHVVDLHKKEMGTGLKYAYKLSDKVLAPQPIERTKVQLADNFFHDSTVAGLEYYSEIYPEWKNTANFMKVIARFWRCVTVQGKFAAIHKRDHRRKVISHEDQDQITFLHNFSTWLQEWEEQSKGRQTGLSRETFLAARHTCHALCDLAHYLLHHDFEYVLLGKINSDPLERRFGWYRQLAGANYFISVRQFLEAEKKIRLRSLVKIDQLSLSDVSALFKDNKSSQTVENAEEILSLLCENTSEVQVSGEEGIICYVAGYIARSLVKAAKCDKCVPLLMKSQSAPSLAIEEEDTKKREEFLQSVSRGGLVTPSDLVYLASACALHLKGDIFDGGIIQEKFLSAKNPRATFVAVLQKQMCNSVDIYETFNQSCSVGHSFLSFIPTIGSKMFNCASKNFITELNDTIHASRKRGYRNNNSAGRKIAKLQSC